MQLSPRYGGAAVLRAGDLPLDVATPVLRQRARLAALLADLDEAQWSTPSRCAGWSVQDVVAHLVTTNQFWAFSVASGLQGAPTTLLETFDPVASPAQMVEAARSQEPAETLAAFIGSNKALADLLVGLDEPSWSLVAEAPPGHIAIGLVALHALWDSWIHERDIVLPLGLDPVEEPDEITGALTYAAALGPAFLAGSGSIRQGVLELRASDPEVRVVVELGPSVIVHDGPAPPGAVVISGEAVELLEALSFRSPFTAPMADDDRWLLGNLAEVFDQSP